MKKVKSLLIMACAALSGVAGAQKTVTIQGNVKFIEGDFKMQVYRFSGTSKSVLAETTVNPETHTYKLEVPADEAGMAVLDCGQWQSVRVWLEDENMNVDFRGMDTAKIKIKNPPYVYIQAGKNNELMNLINYDSYRNYQKMIAVSQAAYRAKFESDSEKQQLTSKMYDMLSDDYRAYMRYYAEHYADRNSVLVPLGSLNSETDKELIDATLTKLSNVSSASKVLVDKYRKEQAEKKERAERMKEGNPVPAFVCENPKGKKFGPDKYKGKVLVLDFWASWCGPCRQEIPNLKNLYETYKDKGVEFMSVSIDAKKDAWEKAMKEEKMAWPQGWVTDAGKGVMDLYQFGGIPFILVIDKEGNIYRKNVRGEAIKTAIDEVLEGKTAGSAPKKTVVSMGMMGM